MSKPGLFMSAMSSGLDMADMAWEMQCRQEDMRQRAIDDARRAVDEKAEQLKAISHQSALIAGFAMVVMVEASLTPDLHPVLLVLFGATSAATVGLMLMAMLNCTLMLVAILTGVATDTLYSGCALHTAMHLCAATGVCFLGWAGACVAGATTLMHHHEPLRHARTHSPGIHPWDHRSLDQTLCRAHPHTTRRGETRRNGDPRFL